MSKAWSRHFVPAEKLKQYYPFSFKISEVTEIHEDTPRTKLNYVIKEGNDFQSSVREHLMLVFDFYKYLNEFSEHNIVKHPEKSPEYFIEVTIFTEIREPQGLTKTGKQRKDKITLVEANTLIIKAHNFTSRYQFTLIETLDQLREVLADAKVLTYDAETSGLDPEFDTIAGINFAKEPGKGYYFAVSHNKQFDEFNLGQEGLDIYYEALTKADMVYMFNSRFDMRVMEYYSYDLDETKTNIINKRYDFRNVKFIDTQISMYFADPEWKDHSLKWAETHFLGYHRPNLNETLKAQKINSFDTTLIDPRKLLFYAAQDAISTLELGYATNHFIKEFKLSGEIDMSIIYPLMDLENRLIRIDTEYLNQELLKIQKRLTEVEKQIFNSIGFDVNLNSSQQRVKLFESFGLDTGVRTEAGAMSTSKGAISDLINKLNTLQTPYPDWLKYLGEQSTLQQLESTFFKSLSEQAGHRNGRVRLNYRHGITATGRFSSGKEE